MNRPYLLALILGALPLLAGLAVFGAWVVTRWEPLIAAGVWVIGLGTLSVLAGLVCLVFAFDRFRSEARLSGGAIGARIGGALGLQLVNFPAAFGLILAAILIEERCVVVLTNGTEHEARDWSLSWPGDDVHVGRWKPGKTHRFAFWCKGEGPITLEVEDLGGRPVEVVVEEYAGSGLGGRWEVLLTDGEPEVTWSPH